MQSEANFIEFTCFPFGLGFYSCSLQYERPLRVHTSHHTERGAETF